MHSQAPQTVLGTALGDRPLAGCAGVVPCPQAATPLLPKDMSSPQFKDIPSRQRGCGSGGNMQQEGMGTGPEEKPI